MAPVFGLAAVAAPCVCRLLQYIIFYLLISAVIYHEGLFATRIYSSCTLLSIKVCMEKTFDSWQSYHQAFPLPFVCPPPSPDYLYLFLAPSKNPGARTRLRRSSRRGCTSGVHAKTKRARQRGFLPLHSGECLRYLVLVVDGTKYGTNDYRDRRHVWRCGILSPWPVILQDHSSTARGTGRTRPHSSCLLSVPHQSAIALLNARSIANKSFVLNDFFSSNSLDFIFLTESWQRENEFIHLNELFPVGCRFIGTPHLDRRGGGLVTVHRDSFACKAMDSESFPSFESQLLKGSDSQTSSFRPNKEKSKPTALLKKASINPHDRGSRVGSSSCNRKVAGSSPGSDSLGRCVLGQDTSPVAYWWWSEGPVVPVSGSLASVSAPQGGCGYNVAYHHQCVNGWMCKALWGP
ncbi:hypothetical protein ACER0C_016127 [Sarotherodon galilaeus]